MLRTSHISKIFVISVFGSLAALWLAIAEAATASSSLAPLAYDPTKVANPSATLPAGETRYAAIRGDLSVSDFGTASYEIPLQVIPGRGGLQPSLAIRYSSNGGNGPLGVGFALTGLSQISRCAKTVADDGIAQGVQLDDTDRFCLNGQKLVLVSGTYGGDGAEYRTLPDSHVRVRSYRSAGTTAKGPSHFVVWTAAGQVQEYGAGGAATVVGNSATPIAWPITRTLDRSNNIISYHYEKNANPIEGERERWLKAIHYGTGSTLDRQIVFEYEDRPDKSYGYRYGYPHESLRRLKSISMYLSDPQQGLRRARHYALGYSLGPATGYSRLASVTECGVAANECKQPTVFTWTPGGNGFQAGLAQTAAIPSSNTSMLISADLNGDGRTDLAYPEAGNWKYVLAKADANNPYSTVRNGGFNAWGTGATAYPFDYDLDGRIDLLPRSPQVSVWRPVLSRGDDGGTVSAKTDYISALNQTLEGESALFGDFNGDGYQDVLEQDLIGTVRRWYWRKRSGTVSPSIDSAEPHDNQAFGPQQEITWLLGLQPSWIFVLDVNGDGRDEIVFPHLLQGDMRALDVVTGAVQPTGLSGALINLDVKLLDLNGDGLTDLVTNGNDSSGKVDGLYHRLNTGRGFASTVAMGVNGAMLKASFKAAEVVDTNGDGRDELLIPKYSGFISAGNPQFSGMDLVQAKHAQNGALTFTVSPTPIGFSLRNIDTLAKQGLRVIDADGDGNEDVLIVDRPTLGASPALRLFRHAAGGRPDLLARIDERSKLSGNPLNVLPVTLALSYAPLTDAGVYTRGQCPRTAFTTCLAGSMHVVKSVRKNAGLSSGANSDLVTEYHYANGRVDKKSRSFLGFAEHKAKSYATGSAVPPVTVRSFYSNTESKHDPRLRERWTYSLLPGARHNLEREILEWSEQQTTNSYFDYPKKTTRLRYEFPNAALTCDPAVCLGTMTLATFNGLSLKFFETHTDDISMVDIFGNVRKRMMDTRGNHGKWRTTYIETSFDYDTFQWLVARPNLITTTDVVENTETSAWMSQTRVDRYSYPPGASPHAARPLQHKQSGSDSNPGPVLTTDFTYDTSGNVLSRKMTDSSTGEVRQAVTVYDPFGYPHAVSNALGQTSYTGYDPVLGQIKIMVDPNGLRTDFSYDTLGNLLQTKLPDGVVMDMAYELEYVASGNEWLLRARSSESTGAVSEAVLDRGGRPVIERFKGFDGAMRVKTRNYEPQGWLQSETAYRRADATGNPERTRDAYDSLGRRVSAIDPDNVERSWHYDQGQVTYTNGRGHRKAWTVDHRGQTIRVVDGVGTPSESARSSVYGPFGNLLSSKTEGIDASRSAFEYDERGRLLSRTDPERGTATYQYNAFGQPVFMRDANGRETTWVYDPLGRATSRSVRHNGTLRSRIDYTYDAIDSRKTQGKLLRLEATDALVGNQTHRIDYYYDSLSRLFRQEHRLPSDIDATVTDAFVMVYDYDNLSRLAALSYPKLPGQPAGAQALYDYAPTDTSNGRLMRVRLDDPLESDRVIWEAVATDGQDRLATDRTGDGLEALREFDWRDLPNKVTLRTASSDTAPKRILMEESYTYDAEGNLTTRSRLNDAGTVVETFGYDPLDRLTMAATGTSTAAQDTWSYDKLGNITFSQRRGSYTYDAQRPTQVTAVQGGLFQNRNYAYDAVGNQVSRPEGNVLYNDFDLPARITAGGSKAPLATFLYTGAGERARKTTNAGAITYVPGLYERHHAGDGIEHRLRVSAGERAVATVSYRQQGATLVRQPIRYPHSDRQGSTNLVTAHDDAATGPKATVIENRSYDAFGHLRNPDWTGAFLDGIQPAQVEQGYTGHDDDREFGLVNMKGRLYDAELGRFLTPDPNIDGANASQAWNRYAYVSNNPLRHTDPTGFLTCFGCPEELLAGGGSSGGFGTGYNPVADLIQTWIDEDEAFFNEGAWGISPLNPDSPAARRLEREYDRFVALGEDERRAEAIKKQQAEIKKRQAEIKKQQEAYKLGLQRAKEAAAKLGGVGGRSAATGSGALAQSDVCDSNSASCSVAVAGCSPGTATCSDAVQPIMDDTTASLPDAPIMAGATLPPRPPVPPRPPILPPPPEQPPPLPEFPKPPIVPREFRPNQVGWFGRAVNFFRSLFTSSPLLPVIDLRLLREYQEKRLNEQRG